MKPFKVIAERKIFEVPGRFSVIEIDLETSEGKKVTWNYISWKDIVVVLPVDKEGNVYIKKEWRQNRKDFVWEVVSGFVEEKKPTDKQILDAAIRETQEEVGMMPGKLEKLITMYPTNHMDNKLHLFLARELSTKKLEGDEHEILEVTKLPFDKAYDLVVNKQVPSAQNAMIFELAKDKI